MRRLGGDPCPGGVRVTVAWAGELRRRVQATAVAGRWLHDPGLWASECITWPAGSDLVDYQADVLTQLATRRRVAMRGPHGTGKSCIASLATLWFATTRDAAGIDWKIPTTASAWRHLSHYLWPEIRKWSRLINWDVVGREPFSEVSELLALNLKLTHGAATAVASNRAELIEGAHADSLLYIVDEGKVVPNDTWDAVEGALSGGRESGLPEAFVLALSTPGPPVGRFYDIHSRKPGYEDWTVRHVTLAEAVKAGRISAEWAAQRARQWGEDSAIYQNRVLGEFAASDEDAVIPLAWVEAAVERWHAWVDAGRPPLEGRRVLGVDVARSGSDSTVFAPRVGPVVTELVEHRKRDTMAVTALVQGELEDDTVPIVDTIGVGAGVLDRLRELGVPAVAYTGSAGTKQRDSSRAYGFVNVRSAAYWRMRELLDPAGDSEVALPPDDLLLSDLTTPTWDITTGVPPKIRIETKYDVVARLGRSPDRGDAVVMSFAADWLTGGQSRVHNPAAAGVGRERWEQMQREPSALGQRYGRRL